MNPPESARLMGQPLRRQEDPRVLVGKGVYVGDLTLPGMLHMAVLRSPHAHARIVARDFAAAACLPGVIALSTPATLRRSKRFPC